MKKLGRSPEHLKILPGALVVVGDTVDEAQEEEGAARQPRSSRQRPRIAVDRARLRRFGLRSRRSAARDPRNRTPARAGASASSRSPGATISTVRQLAQIAGSYGGLAFVGTPATIADEMEQWLFEEGCDGFNIMFPYVPEGLDDFVDKVVPELQRRGLFRREYEGRTLRENLGLPRPENQFFGPERAG